jgi:hypothetical protein
VAAGQGVDGVGAVSKVAQVRLADVGAALLELGVGEVPGLLLVEGVDVLHDDVEHALDGVVLFRAEALPPAACRT